MSTLTPNQLSNQQLQSIISGLQNPGTHSVGGQGGNGSISTVFVGREGDGGVYSGVAPIPQFRINGKDMSKEEFDKWLKDHDEVQEALVRGSIKAGVNIDI